MKKITDLQPTIVWKYFNEILQIPRPSGSCEKITKYLKKSSLELGLEVIVTKVGNVIVRKNAAKGYENKKTVLLQSHMDMVANKTLDSKHDFNSDPISACIEGSWIKSDNTTLGADNGLGIAIILGILASKSSNHGPIEALFTVDEETSGIGAKMLRSDELSPDYIINFDEIFDGMVTIGCAGLVLADIDINFKKNKIDSNYVGLKIELNNLSGGHSGADIKLSSANAIREMVNIVYSLQEKFDVKLSKIDGGQVFNVIPTDCDVEIAVRKNDEIDIIRYLKLFEENLKKEFIDTDKKLNLDVKRIKITEVIENKTQLELIKVLLLTHHGEYKKNNDLNESETSSNFGTIKTEKNQIQIQISIRSMYESATQKIMNILSSAYYFLNSEIKFSLNCDSWTPIFNSQLLKIAKKEYKKLFNEEVHIGVVHGGLECGMILKKFPEAEAISIGVRIINCHTPFEKVYIPSIIKCWKFINKILETI